MNLSSGGYRASVTRIEATQAPPLGEDVPRVRGDRHGVAQDLEASIDELYAGSLDDFVRQREVLAKPAWQRETLKQPRASVPSGSPSSLRGL
jgi:hypothetical protein